MVHELATEVYQSKYQKSFEIDQYFTYLQAGIDLLKADSLKRTNNPTQLMAMNIALEYNMELMMKELLK